jgi:hypothetical protein
VIEIKSKVTKITNKEAEEIITTRKPLGLFYTIEKKDGNSIYIGIDNADGSAWTEDFKSLSSCKRWLGV